MIGGDLEIALKAGLAMWALGVLIGLYLLKKSYKPMTSQQKFWRVMHFAMWFGIVGIFFGYLDNGNSGSSCREFNKWASSC